MRSRVGGGRGGRANARAPWGRRSTTRRAARASKAAMRRPIAGAAALRGADAVVGDLQLHGIGVAAPDADLDARRPRVAAALRIASPRTDWVTRLEDRAGSRRRRLPVDRRPRARWRPAGPAPRAASASSDLAAWRRQRPRHRVAQVVERGAQLGRAAALVGVVEQRAGLQRHDDAEDALHDALVDRRARGRCGRRGAGRRPAGASPCAPRAPARRPCPATAGPRARRRSAPLGARSARIDAEAVAAGGQRDADEMLDGSQRRRRRAAASSSVRPSSTWSRSSARRDRRRLDRAGCGRRRARCRPRGSRRPARGGRRRRRRRRPRAASTRAGRRPRRAGCRSAGASGDACSTSPSSETNRCSAADRRGR